VQGSIVLAVSLSPTGDWTQAAAIMTFAIPVGIFVVVATWLYFLYTRPHAVPGHRELALAGGGRHAAGGPRRAAGPPPSGGQPFPPDQPPGGGAPGSGGYGNDGETEGR
jgi:hypothetical protein